MSKLLAATAMTSLAFIAVPAFAQDTAAQDATEGTVNTSGIGEIVVTAQKRSENIQNVPIAISAVGSQFLGKRRVPVLP